MPFSVLRKSASISSDSSGERICRKLTTPYLPPSPNIRALPKRNEDGAIKSLVESPDGGKPLPVKGERFSVRVENAVHDFQPFPWRPVPHAEAPMLLK